MRGLWQNPLATPPSSLTDAALLLGRICIVIALIPNGVRKISTFAQTAAGMGGMPQMIDGRLFPNQTPLFHFPMPEFFLAGSVVFDLLGAILVLVGWRTRSVAALLAVYVAAAMLIFHSDLRHAQDVMHVLRNLPFLGGLLMLAGVGGGHWSVDGWRNRRS